MSQNALNCRNNAPRLTEFKEPVNVNLDHILKGRDAAKEWMLI